MFSSFSHQFSSVNGRSTTRLHTGKPQVKPVQAARAVSSVRQWVWCACLPETTSPTKSIQQLHLPGQNQFNIPDFKELPKLTVAVDVDEVLARFLDALNLYCKDRHGMVYDIADYDKYEFAKIWGCSSEYAAHIVHEFFTSEHFLEGVCVVPGSKEALDQLSSMTDVNLEIVTSRQNVITKPTKRWIYSNFPGIFGDRVHICNQWSLEGKQRSKSEVCLQIGADILIDDNPRYAVECAKKGIQVLLFDWQSTYPWAQQLPQEWVDHELITVVKSWQEIELELLLVVAERSESGQVQSSSV
eukprot:TRINITY_DN2227_c0_g2_i1.p1 TRINITY_DN2227_c0_g2~~TRINITY_DN2227_c0_g2_i1.p1  ORF type:complete len:300 (-),score=24.82 TRINITY_DN2227_c0_g2_i1:347-1246(-)